MTKYSGLLPLLALLASCSAVSDFSPGSAFDMPSETEKGYAALKAGDNPGAVKWLSIASGEKPDDPYLKVDLAAAYQRLGKFEEAKKLYQTVVDTAQDVTPDKVADPKLQGKTLAEIAAADLAICSACDMPSEAGKGYAALSEEDGPGAVKWLSAASEAKPDDLYLMLDLAAAERKLGQAEEARRLYQSIVDKTKAAPPPKVADAPPQAAPPPELVDPRPQGRGRPGNAAPQPQVAIPTAAAAPKPQAKTVAEIAAADLALLSK